MLALQLSIEDINTIMQEYSGLGETGEVYLVGADGLGQMNAFDQFFFRSTPRSPLENAVLNPRYPVNTVAARSAIAGETGYGVITNYQGDRVLSSWSPLNIPGLEWAIIAEMGLEEAFTPRSGPGEKDLFGHYRDTYEFHDVFLISPEGGFVFYSVAHEPDYRTSLLSGPYKDTNLGQLISHVLETKQFGITDFERYAPSQGAPAAFMAQPVLDAAGNIEVIVAVQLSHEGIDAIMQERAGLGETGEIYLVGPDLLWRSDSPFLNQLGVTSTVLNPAMQVDTVAAHEALAGRSGTRTITNYQGLRTPSSWAPFVLVEPSPLYPDGVVWAVIAEIEESEVNRPVVQLALTAGALGIITVLAIILAVFLVSRRHAAPIVDIARAATAVADGDLTQRVDINTGDEVEELASAFNQMADEIAQMVSALEQLATTDPLTGLFNRRHFFELAQKEIDRARRYHHPISLLMLDLDDFKHYNDRYGHQAGDELLSELTEVITAIIRETDIAARYGGEEFVLMLPETSGPEAEALAERLCAAVRDHPFTIRGQEHPGQITVSVGVATHPHHAQDIDGLVHAADMALLQAKVEKDRVFLASSH